MLMLCSAANRAEPLAGMMNLEPILSKPLTASTMISCGLARVISDLHCGHSIFGAVMPVLRSLLFGASISAIQSNRHSSCATNAHGHGSRHGDVSGVSSVSSEKHIQHFLTDGSSAGLYGDGEVAAWTCVDASSICC